MTEFGGPLSDPESEKMNGSLLVAEAESAAAVRAVMESDIYWSSNVVSPVLPFPLSMNFVVVVVVDAYGMLGFCVSWRGTL